MDGASFFYRLWKELGLDFVLRVSGLYRLWMVLEGLREARNLAFREEVRGPRGRELETSPGRAPLGRVHRHLLVEGHLRHSSQFRNNCSAEM